MTEPTDQPDEFDQMRLYRDTGATNITMTFRQAGASLGPLSRLALFAGALHALTEGVHEAMVECVAAGESWPDISDAIGEGREREDYRRVRARFQYRLKQEAKR